MIRPTRRLLVLLACIGVGTATVLVPGPATAGARTSHHRVHRHGRRVGGRVRRAWPRVGRKPRSRQVRWLARQVGATRPRGCARPRRRARRRCHLRRHVTRRATAAAAASSALPLQLVRSYQIPADDPSYERLLNWSWTYDSSVAAAAFAASGDQANAGQLLDQLAALQYTDGSIEIAFNTATGAGARIYRSGTVAWLGLAAATYDKAFGSTRYLDTETRAADYLLSLKTGSGLIRGGPDVSWVSTEHNLIAYVFLARLAAELKAAGRTAAAATYQAAATALSAAINANLLVGDSSGARFRQGLGDDTQALDVQALGAMYLQGIGQPKQAAQVLAYAQATFAVSGRSVALSKDPATYNLAYEAAGPYSGYAPYAGTNAPDVMWAEGSGEMRLAEAALGQDTGALDKSIASWAAITGDAGALQADRTVSSAAFGVEYHVWPASTASAWTVLAQSAPAFFAAPLPAATALVTDWTKVRGGNLITTFADGRVEMPTVGGERRVLAGSPSATDYTVTSNATLLSGAGYGVYVRATVDSGTKLTGYCVQLDHGFGQLIVRELQGDFELSTPLARANVPAGFAWYGVPHAVVVTAKGNTLTATLDGTPTIAISDLAAASAAAAKTSSNVTTTITPPAAGGYGLRAWSDALVSLQQMTVGPAS